MLACVLQIVSIPLSALRCLCLFSGVFLTADNVVVAVARLRFE